MRWMLVLAATALMSAPANVSYADQPQSDIASYPALPPPSEAELAAAPQLRLEEYPWVQSPNVVDFLYVFPREALRERVGGAVELNCLVQTDYRVACRVVSEDPGAYGFGEAAMTLSGKLRVAPTLTNGAPTAGGRWRWTVDFASHDRVRTVNSRRLKPALLV